MTPRSILQTLIGIYKRYVSPGLHSSCRFTPTCSDYAAEAIERHGAFTGSFLAAGRLLRCNPFFRGGLDTVPSREELTNIAEQVIQPATPSLVTCHFERSAGTLRQYKKFAGAMQLLDSCRPVPLFFPKRNHRIG